MSTPRLFDSVAELQTFILWCQGNGVHRFESPEASFVVGPRLELPKGEPKPSLTPDQELDQALGLD